MDPTPLCSSPSILQIYLVFNWSILNDNVKTHLFFEFRFAAFPGKTISIRLSITGKSLLKQVRLDLVKLTDYTATRTRAVSIGQ